jgi:hypothetical protein
MAVGGDREQDCFGHDCYLIFYLFDITVAWSFGCLPCLGLGVQPSPCVQEQVDVLFTTAALIDNHDGGQQR